MTTPGAYVKCKDQWGAFETLMPSLGEGPVLAVADERVLALHPGVKRALAQKKNVTCVALRAGERVKALSTLERLTQAALALPRSMTVLAIGGGTIGDVATVFAHTFKRGVGRFIQVPTTVLAAVDSSVGGKGAVNVGGTKNVLGVFHAAQQAWLCPQLFTTLSPAQRREGRIEAWKMVVTLDAKRWKRWVRAAPDDAALIRSSRELKHALVRTDPYETTGQRVVLNFGHTLGHAIETVSGYRVRHGEAVGLGMLYALDVGVHLGVTSARVAQEVERSLPLAPGSRAKLASWLAPHRRAAISQALRSDKKTGMVLLVRPGRWHFLSLPSGERSAEGGVRGVFEAYTRSAD